MIDDRYKALDRILSEQLISFNNNIIQHYDVHSFITNTIHIYIATLQRLVIVRQQ